MKNIYISYSYADQKSFNKNHTALKVLENICINYNIRQLKYEKEYIENADAVVFVLPNLRWFSEISALSAGITSEINYAKKENKKTFIAYETKNGDIKIYEAVINSWEIKGRENSSHVFFDFIKNTNKLPNVLQKKNNEKDKRLLLTINSK
jgi:hypothetical protein